MTLPRLDAFEPQFVGATLAFDPVTIPAGDIVSASFSFGAALDARVRSLLFRNDNIEGAVDVDLAVSASNLPGIGGSVSLRDEVFAIVGNDPDDLPLTIPITGLATSVPVALDPIDVVGATNGFFVTIDGNAAGDVAYLARRVGLLPTGTIEVEAMLTLETIPLPASGLLLLGGLAALAASGRRRS